MLNLPAILGQPAGRRSRRPGRRSSSWRAASLAGSLLFAATTLASSASGAAGDGPAADVGLQTGRGHVVQIIPAPTQGLEAGIPKDSWYARGIALDMQQKWDTSYEAYGKAAREFEAQLSSRPQWEKLIRGWLLKAEFQRSQSQRLKYRSHYSWGPPSASMIYYRAAAMHNKWLAIRAFTGHGDRKLRAHIIEDYKKALAQSQHYDSARIALAAMYHELGEHTQGRQEFSRVQANMRVWLALEVAYYYTAAGELDKAFELLKKAIQYNSSSTSHILRANDFDRLRGDPRFKKLVGEP